FSCRHFILNGIEFQSGIAFHHSMSASSGITRDDECRLFLASSRETKMKLKQLVSSLITAGALAGSTFAYAAATDFSSCCTPGDKDFPKVGGNLGNQAYSSLKQIDKSNVKNLGPIWRNHVSAASPANEETGQQTTPLVIDGVIYLDAPNGDVIAVDG